MKVPVIILSGFLGSGKTTLLLQLIHEAVKNGLLPSILMNELGKQDVDGQILAETAPDTPIEKLMDGCICCSKKDEVANSLVELLAKKSDVIFIELTGVANPEELADCLSEPQLIHKLFLKQIITILDAENVLDYNSIFSSDKNLVHTLRRQIEAADMLIVNKTDLAAPKQLPKIEKIVRKQNPQAALYFTTKSLIQMDLIFNDLKPLEHKPQVFNRFQGSTTSPYSESHSTNDNVHTDHHDHQKASFSRVQSITLPYQYNRPLKSKQFEKFLQNLGPKLLRAKGYLSLTDRGEVFLMHYAAQRTTWEPSRYNDSQYIVFIGIDLDTQHLREEWQHLTGADEHH